jgi:hypothetical protein
MSEYTLVDCMTDLVYGPYESCGIARMHAYDLDLKRWEILNQDGDVVDWGRDRGYDTFRQFHEAETTTDDG